MSEQPSSPTRRPGSLRRDIERALEDALDADRGSLRPSRRREEYLEWRQKELRIERMAILIEVTERRADIFVPALNEVRRYLRDLLEWDIERTRVRYFDGQGECGGFDYTGGRMAHSLVERVFADAPPGQPGFGLDKVLSGESEFLKRCDLIVVGANAGPVEFQDSGDFYALRRQIHRRSLLLLASSGTEPWPAATWFPSRQRVIL